MSLFQENTWESNTDADKLSNQLFKQNTKTSKKNKKRPNKNGAIGTNKQAQTAKTLTKNKESNQPVSKKQKRKLSITEKNVDEKKAKLIKDHDTEENVVKNQVKKKKKKSKQKSLIQQSHNNAVNMKKNQKLPKTGKKELSKNDTEATSSQNNKNPLDVTKIQRLLSLKKKRDSQKEMSLRARMIDQLRASRFRYLNETLYNNQSSESKTLFKEDPDAFEAYHTGYRQQVKQWPMNPLDIIIAAVKKMPKDHIIADFGCGDAKLGNSVEQQVHSFDLVAVNDKVTACDMAHTPLLACSVNVAVFCLSLMGQNLSDYLLEANRVLKDKGILKIADVESRFDNVQEFIKSLEKYGFQNSYQDLSNNLFYFLDFRKVEEVTRRNNNLPQIFLKSCLYKKR